MADRQTEKRARFALADLEAGRLQAVAAFLAKLGDVPEPELTAPELPKKRKASRRAAPPVPVVDYNSSSMHENVLRQLRGQEPVTPLPKPTKRHVDRDNLASFAERFPDCAIRGCRSGGEIDTHHLRKRSAGGSDSDENLLRLHRNEHDEYHRIGPEAFRAKYASRLRPTDLLKIRLAGELEAEAKLAGRPAIDLDEVEA